MHIERRPKRCFSDTFKYTGLSFKPEKLETEFRNLRQLRRVPGGKLKNRDALAELSIHHLLTAAAYGINRFARDGSKDEMYPFVSHNAF